MECSRVTSGEQFSLYSAFLGRQCDDSRWACSRQALLKYTCYRRWRTLTSEFWQLSLLQVESNALNLGGNPKGFGVAKSCKFQRFFLPKREKTHPENLSGVSNICTPASNLVALLLWLCAIFPPTLMAFKGSYNNTQTAIKNNISCHSN